MCMGLRKNLLVMFGGASSEHEISCISASSVLKHIDKEKYNIYKMGITKEGNWFLTSSPVANISDGSWEKDKNNRPASILPHRADANISIVNRDGTCEQMKVDVVFPVLHGKNGEDGTMQGLLQIAGIPFVGSGAASSAACMDKAITKAMVEHAGRVAQAKCFVSFRRTYEKDKAAEVRTVRKFFEAQLPLFVKPANAGSSVGISKVKSYDQLEAALDKAFAEDGKVVVEEMITGREIEVAVLGNEAPRASCIGEIFAANEFYDYEAKYQNQESKTGIVTDLDKALEDGIRSAAVSVYETMGCRGLARVDFFLEESGRVVFNEINTLPGFTQISMYPKLWEESGIPYSELIDRLIELACE